jgi:hypothetical protein
MSGTAKWLIVGSVVVMALASLIALGVFVLWAFNTPMMSPVNTGWGIFDFRGMGEAWSGKWGRGSGMMGSYGGGMMGGRGFGGYQSGDAISAEPLTMETVEARLEDFLDGREDLELGEIMIFDNHAYAQVIETETDIGAMEVLVDPFTLSVTPEYGPNMMWNTKYGMHGGGMMGFSWRDDDMDEILVSEEDAVEYAQAYLDRYSPDLNADEHADPFYGYFTIHTLRNGEVVGMLSVNGFSGDVFPHTWHGTLLEMSEAHHD